MIQKLFDTKWLGLFAIALSLGALGAAYVAEYAFGLRPCPLCLYQRLPYAAAIVFGLLSFRFGRSMLALAGISFLANAALAGFHAGVEYGWWKGLASCDSALGKNASFEDLQRMLSMQDVARCDKPAWTLFGVSMAGYNFMLALISGIAVFYFLRGSHGRQEKI